jgi:hypothetical protein
VGLAVCLPVLYVLSVGPAIWLATRDMLSKSEREALETLYTPLDLLHETHLQPITDGLDWYVVLWRNPETVDDSAPDILSY